MDILLVHPQFSKIGGAEKVSLKIIELLLAEFNAQLTVLSFSPLNQDQIKLQTGISINSQRIKSEIVTVPSIFRDSGFYTKIALLHREARRLAASHSYLISTYNELDFGKPGLQYVHHLMLASEKILIENHLADTKKFPFNTLSKFYRIFGDSIAKRTISNISNNITATNSHFINRIYEDVYKSKSTVIYPSLIKTEAYPKKKTLRKKQILNISRFAPQKNLTSLVSIFDKINEFNPDFSFVIAGHIESQDYYNFIKKEIEKRNYTIRLLPNCSRKEIIDLYYECEYYINPKEYEHFGIAVLEAARSGCIPFVHASGGSLELIPNKELQFLSIDEIIEKLTFIESSKDIKNNLKGSLQNHVSNFNEEKFKSEMFNLIEHYVSLNSSLIK